MDAEHPVAPLAINLGSSPLHTGLHTAPLRAAGIFFLMKEHCEMDSDNSAAIERKASQKIPLIEESVQVKTEEVETGTVRVSKLTEVQEIPVELLLSSTQAVIEHEPINQYVDQTFGPRQEGDTIIVPIFEGVIIKQLVLKEEVHIQLKEETHEIHKRLAVRG